VLSAARDSPRPPRTPGRTGAHRAWPRRRPGHRRRPVTGRPAPDRCLYTVDGGCHTIPRTRKAPFFMGRADMTFDTVETVARFFPLHAGHRTSA
jgi:poly(3-hydroxybutyrate) depolymerase